MKDAHRKVKQVPPVPRAEADTLRWCELPSLIGRVFFDDKFQRKPGAWIIKMKRQLLWSAWRGYIKDPINLVCIESCLKLAKTTGDVISEKYFQDLLDRGYEYICTDGQHRLITAVEYMTGELDIHEIITTTQEGTFRITFTEKTFYGDLDMADARAVDNLQLKVVRYKEMTYFDLPKSFRVQNIQAPMKPQELRRTNGGPYMEFAESAAAKYPKIIELIFSPNAIDRRAGEEYFLKKFALYEKSKDVMNPINPTTTFLDKFASEDQIPFDKQQIEKTKEFEKIVKQVNSILTASIGKRKNKKTAEALIKERKIGKQWFVDNLFMLVQYLQEEEGLKLGNKDKMYELCYLLVEAEHFRRYEHLRNGDPEPCPYYLACANFKPDVAKLRLRHIAAWVDQFRDLFVASGYFKPLPRKTGRRLFTLEEKHRLAVLQGGECACGCGMKTPPIPHVDFSTKWAAHHVIHYKDGGETVLENAQLLYKPCHIKVHQPKAKMVIPAQNTNTQAVAQQKAATP